MTLPEHIHHCIDRLEAAGFAAYCVGGCVRDHLLGLAPHDFDLCTSATPEQIKQVFSDLPLVLNGEKHGTVSVILGREPVEITAFRAEGSYTDSRHPDWVRFVTSIEDDLSRRDFTVNAMAYSPTRGFADPFGGQQDLKDGVLRAVGDPVTRFTEDALRILRGVRFVARFCLTPEPATEEAMLRCAPLMAHLAQERIFDELCKLLPHASAADLLRYAPVLTQVIPELAPTLGFDQHSPHHAYDVFTHTAHVVQAVSKSLVLRWAALLHDIGKPAVFSRDKIGRGHFPGHAAVSAKMAEQILRRLRAPNALCRQVTDLVALHMLPPEPDKRLLRRRLSKYGAETVTNLLRLQFADFQGKGTKEESEVFCQAQALIDEILAENACLSLKDLAINGRDLQALGFSGKAIGHCLSALLAQVIDEQLPNEKSALLQASENYRILEDPL